MHGKRALQIVLVVIGLILTITGVLGMVGGISDDFYAVQNAKDAKNVVLDSNLRFYSGLSVGLGLMLFCIIPSIAEQKNLLVMITLMTFLGGVGRVVSMITLDFPSPLFILFTLLELASPLLILWQGHISQ